MDNVSENFQLPLLLKRLKKPIYLNFFNVALGTCLLQNEKQFEKGLRFCSVAITLQNSIFLLGN